MPKPGALAREDEVLELICAELSREGRSAQITDRPDRNSSLSDVPPVDAIIRVVEEDYGEEWAVDICLASDKFDPRIPPAIKELKDALTPPLTLLALKANRSVSLSCPAYVRMEKVSGKEWRAMMATVYRNILDRAAMALSRPDGEWMDSEVAVLWRPEILEPLVRISPRDPFINQGFRFSPSVRGKLEGQLRRARDAGYRTLLVLDQEPPRDTPWIGDILPNPYEIGQGIAFAVAYCRTMLDAAILVDYRSAVHEVYKRVGKQASSCCSHCQLNLPK